MKRIIALSCVLLLICSCSNSTKTTVDLTVGNIGDTVSIIDESVGNENWYIVTDTVCYNDTIVNQLVQLTCEKYDSLKKTIHRGENCRANNAAALAIAKQSGDKERIAYLNNQNDEAEKNAAKASIELIEHLQVCDACKKLNNQ